MEVRDDDEDLAVQRSRVQTLVLNEVNDFSSEPEDPSKLRMREARTLNLERNVKINPATCPARV
jgi:hypothetical protein